MPTGKAVRIDNQTTIVVVQNQHNIIRLLLRLWSHLSKRRKFQVGFLCLFMIASSFAEIMSLGAVLPFLAVLSSPEKMFDHRFARPFISLLGLTEPRQLILPLAITFGVAAVISGIMRLTLIWANTRLSFAAGGDLSYAIYRKTLYQPYSVHLSRNSSKVISGIIEKTGAVTASLNNVLTFSSAVIMMVTIVSTLIVIEPLIAFSAFAGFGSIYAVIIFFTRHRLQNNGLRISQGHTNVIKSLQEGLGGIRDVLIDGCQEIYTRVYRNADLLLRKAQSANIFISISPRYVLEALGMLLIALLAYLMSVESNGMVSAIPVLGAIAIGAQRLLPLLQQAYTGWSDTQGRLASLVEALELLEQPLPDYADKPPAKPIGYQQKIELKGLSYRYGEDTPWVLRDIDLTIPKGSRIGIIGTTGSGKSTMLDIIMGLLSPTAGSLLIDRTSIQDGNRRTWQAHIAHVPQAIFLSDNTVEENIVFGIPTEEIDRSRVRVAARLAQIGDIIESWPKKYQTVVGERGVRLSGGQRQRIGIARALYKHADVIVLDEATSALDNETEAAVMHAIETLDREITIIMIAHRLTTLKGCTRIIELADGRILRSGTYADMIGSPIPLLDTISS
ncbi:MAG: ABC transporter ATP-binding protein [Chlorobiaceae bacterium]|nr:ABC transporter ATP-binding protein [Chlorobiaceae bacterium]